MGGDQKAHSIQFLTMRKILFFLIIATFFSCTSSKYTYLFDTGSQLDFSKGKWILNKPQSNSKIFDAELYDVSFKYFKKILMDSLVELNDIRRTKLIPSKIDFVLKPDEIKKLKTDSNCSFIINIKGEIISNGAGTISVQSDNPYYNASNKSSVSIKIYDLESGMLISSSQVYAKSTNEGSHFDDGNSFPNINTSSHSLMLTGAKKLIKKYKKIRLDK